MFSIPTASIGVVGGLLLTHTAFSMQAYIGVIMLAGIVVSNAILLVDYTNVLRRRDNVPLPFSPEAEAAPASARVPARQAQKLARRAGLSRLDETEGVLTRQIEADLSDVPDDRLGEVVIAYEPIWAIGTGRTATPEQAQEACALIRGLIEARSSETAAAIRILYGGSVKPGNAAELVALPDVDGALVGGASLDPDDFAAIVEAAV